MLSKRDQYSCQLAKCMANADRSWETTRSLWLNLADSYQMLIEYEDRYPSPPTDTAAQKSDWV